jgi:hypothetical protein
MKKSVITLLAALLFFTNISAQKVYIKKIIDQMEEEPMYLISRDIVLSNPTKTKGIRMDAFIDAKDTSLFVGDISVRMVNIGSNCVENNELVILFQDDTKIVLNSWNKFNCDGNAWFHLSEEDEIKLSTLKIKKIKITNGSTYDSFTSELKPVDSDYYIQLYKALKDKNIKQINK